MALLLYYRSFECNFHGDTYVNQFPVERIFLTPILFSFKQTYEPLSAVNGCRDTGLQKVVTVFLNQKRNEFLKYIVWHDK